MNDIQALQAKSNNKKGKFKRKRGKKNTNYKKRDLSKVQCYKCDKFGHTHMDCPERKKNPINMAEVKEAENSLVFLALSSELTLIETPG